MRLVVDASILVPEVLRARGRALLSHPALDLALAKETWSETEHELRKRVALIAERGIFPFGCDVAVWITETLLAHLKAQETATRE